MSLGVVFVDLGQRQCDGARGLISVLAAAEGSVSTRDTQHPRWNRVRKYLAGPSRAAAVVG